MRMLKLENMELFILVFFHFNRKAINFQTFNLNKLNLKFYSLAIS